MSALSMVNGCVLCRTSSISSTAPKPGRTSRSARAARPMESRGVFAVYAPVLPAGGQPHLLRASTPLQQTAARNLAGIRRVQRAKISCTKDNGPWSARCSNQGRAGKRCRDLAIATTAISHHRQQQGLQCPARGADGPGWAPFALALTTQIWSTPPSCAALARPPRR